MVDVERREETLGVGDHFIGGEQPVMVAVGLLEPVGERVVAAVRARNGSPIGLMNGAHAMAGDGDRRRLAAARREERRGATERASAI